MFKDFLVFLIFTFGLNVYASNNNLKVYTVGIEEDQKYPFYYIYDKEFKGRVRNLLDSFAKAYNIKFIYQISNRISLQEDLIKKKIDFKFPDNPSWNLGDKNNNPEIIYSNPFTHNIDAIFVNKDFKRGDKKKLINNFGLVNDIILRDLDKRTKAGNVKVIKSDCCADLVIMLARNQLDAIFCDLDVVKYLIKNSSLKDEVVFNADLPFIDGFSYLSTISHEDIIRSFDIWLNNNRSYIEGILHEN
ncbi:MAG: hypothetical protein SFT68_05450 [Rickettsiaceae bacterium]|nr:hypothetical protein [Rickettsiaceae bacterium]